MTGLKGIFALIPAYSGKRNIEGCQDQRPISIPFSEPLKDYTAFIIRIKEENDEARFLATDISDFRHDRADFI